MNELTIRNNSGHLAPWQAMPLEERDALDSRKLWRTLWQRKGMILALVLVGATLASLYALSMTPAYKAVTTLVIEPKGNTVITFQQTPDAPDPNSDYLQTQMGLIQSREVAERAVRELNLATHPELDPRQIHSRFASIKAQLADWHPTWFPSTWQQQLNYTDQEAFDSAVMTLRGHTSVTVVGKSHLVSIGVTLADRETAARAANALAQGYLDSRQQASEQDSITASRWMNTRMVELRTQLQQSESKLQAYRDGQGLVDVGGVTTITANELARTSDRLVDARRERADAQSQYRQVQGLLAKGGALDLSSVPAVINNPVIQQFQGVVATAQAQVDELSQRYGPKHPKLVAARSELAAAQSSLRTQVSQVVAGLQHNYQLAQDNENALRASFNSNKQEIQDISRKEFTLRELQRDVDSNREVYNTFMTKLRETMATADLAAGNARIVDPAIAPLHPNTPRKAVLVALATFLALVAGCALALAREAFNNSFKSSLDVERQLQMPVLSVVPLLKRRNRARIHRQYERNDDAAFSEAVRTLRTSVLLNDEPQRRKVLLMTSTTPAEGKTTLAINLAGALARMERVLLIEADLRRPKVAHNLGLDAHHPGLAELLADRAGVSACIQSLGALDVVCAGTVPYNPQELLAGARMQSFLQWAGQHYDRVILDSPASQSVSDAALLCSSADSVIYVVKSEATSLPQVRKTLGQLMQAGAPVVGVVLNQVARPEPGQRRDHYYDYLPAAPAQ
ncbi:polysaccharide biosynthesis tyrosine autokinase [Pseudomonas sp. NPDC007930]|uniref:GumC family protein n=1 Tax=Pseudomonas sp. NPDC007930 TaxID=3364417 RepID=UPI0036EEE83C